MLMADVVCKEVHCWRGQRKDDIAAVSKGACIIWHPIHVRAIWARLLCINGSKMLDDGTGCNAKIVAAYKDLGPHSFE